MPCQATDHTASARPSAAASPCGRTHSTSELTMPNSSRAVVAGRMSVRTAPSAIAASTKSAK